jgi:ParB-like chromosome segregation protein Spo0J
MGTLARTLARLEDYRELTRDFGETPERAAARMGLSRRTAERYERRLRASTGSLQRHDPKERGMSVTPSPLADKLGTLASRASALLTDLQGLQGRIALRHPADAAALAAAVAGVNGCAAACRFLEARARASATGAKP